VKGERYVGLMSGTSLDGIDAVLVEFDADRIGVLAARHRPYDPELRAQLAALGTPGADEIERAALAANRLARECAALVGVLLAATGLAPAGVRAIGCHGQTVRHRPERGYTVQIANAALLAELTQIAVVADFRSRDLAAGGEGAPLVPAFHRAVFAQEGEARAVLNVGGIANVTLLPQQGDALGFDCGPGNVLMDLWAARHLGAPFDAGGAWAAGAAPLPELLERMLAEPYFARRPPKSTGRELFDAAWLERHLAGGEDPQAVQASLLELTARAAATAVSRHLPDAQRLIVCGGGAKNATLLARLAALLPAAKVETSAAHGLDPQYVEACAFAWLARERLAGRPANLPQVTGARGLRVLGALYSA